MSDDKSESFLQRWARLKRQTGQTAADAKTDAAPPALPPLDKLSFDSDFSPFMQPQVDAQTRKAALKKLFMSPHYRASDGLDVYIGDYSSPEPLAAAVAAGLVQAKTVLDAAHPPKQTEQTPGGDGAGDIPAEQVAVAPPKSRDET